MPIWYTVQAMQKINTKTIHFIISLIVILAVSFLDPQIGKALESFQGNIEKSYYFENCITSADQQASEFVDVVSVADGDTLHISSGCEAETVRLLGADTPETVDPRKPVQCFGVEASVFTKDLLEGKRVKIEIDPTQGERDKYGRLLGYVILEDGTNFNLKLIQEGYATEYTYNGVYRHRNTFLDAQKEAKDIGRGLWAHNTCNGEK